MSRHRFVRNINIHDELQDDHDDEGDDPFDSMTADQQAQLDTATDTVIGVLGAEKDSFITEEEIRRSLWDSYFDTNETLEWAFGESVSAPSFMWCTDPTASVEEQKKRKAAKEKRGQYLLS